MRDEQIERLAEAEALRFTAEDIENAQEAMGEGEWQWFQWLLREKVRALAPVVDAMVAEAWGEALTAVLARADEGNEFGPQNYLLLLRIVAEVTAALSDRAALDTAADLEQR